MKIDPKTIKMSTVRDWIVDPLEADEALQASIKENEHWGGSVVRRLPDGNYEAVSGSKRISEAIKAGLSEIDVHVSKCDDRKAIRIYATENVTQRGTTAGLAMAGAVASAIHYIAKAILNGDKNSVPGIQGAEKGKNDLEHAQAYLAGEKGIGAHMILSFYKGIDGINKNLVTEHLANLKASGDYARIINKASDDVERENAEDIAELERKKKEAEEKAEADKAAKLAKQKAKTEEKAAKAKETGQKAKAAAAKKPKTFDLNGVGKFLTTQHQLKTFRDIVERESVRAHLPVNKQAQLAEAIAKQAKEQNAELSGTFISEYMFQALGGVVSEETKANKAAMKQMEHEDVLVKWRATAHHFCRNVGGIAGDARTLIKMKDQHPDLPFSITQELRRAVTYAQPVINQLAAKLNI